MSSSILSRYRRIFWLGAGLLASQWPVAPAQADAQALCKPLAEAIPPRPLLERQPQGDELLLTTDQAVVRQVGQTSLFSGDVIAQRGSQVLRADHVLYRRLDNSLEATGNVTLWDEAFVVRGQHVQLYGKNRGSARDNEYWLLGETVRRRGHGKAEYVDRINESQFHLQNTTYTTCDPDNEVWRVKGSSMDLDFDSGVGEAWHATLELYDVPVFYFPYLNFPVDDRRKSGFLPPTLGNSKSTGIDLRVPYYWNIAPNYDATFTPRVLGKRGLMLETEFRYLTESSKGQVNLEYLPDDDEYGDDRSFLKFAHQTRFTPKLRTSLLYQEASDINYFDDLGDRLGVTDPLTRITHLQRYANLVYTDRIGKQGYQASAKVLDYQTLSANPAAKPYVMKPQLALRTLSRERNRELNYKLGAEYTYFDHTAKNRWIGDRADAKFSLSYPLRYAAGFFVPRARLRHTRYALDQVNTDATRDIDRTLPTLSADSGLFFERAEKLWGKDLLHTLEPRLFYVYTPYEDQDEIPLFDTAESTFAFSQLFREDRFSGVDRIGDENRLSYALTTRLLARRDGLEHLRASIGQIHYFEDRRVQRSSRLPAQTDDSSDIIAELASQFTKNLSAQYTVQWDPRDGDNEKTTARLRYRPGGGQLLNLTYRYRKSEDEQTDVAWQWPLSNRWSTVARWNYSLRYDVTLESFLGLSYESCCWAVRALARRYLQNLDEGYENGIFLQFELKGLTGLGRRTEGFLREQIPDYEDEFEF